MIKNKEIIIDLDNTIINSPLTIINLHNKLNPNKQYQYTDELNWNFSPIIKSKEELSELFMLFDNPSFYDEVKIYDGAIEFINELAKSNKVIICSKHNENRKPISTEWIKRAMPNVELVFVDSFEQKGNLFPNAFAVIDDRIDSLDSFNNNLIKICFGNYSWNKEWEGLKFDNWGDIKKTIKYIRR